MNILHILTADKFERMWEHLNRFDKLLSEMPDNFLIQTPTFNKRYVNIEKSDCIRGMEFDKVIVDEYFNMSNKISFEKSEEK